MKQNTNQSIPRLERAFTLLKRVQIKGNTATVGSDKNYTKTYIVNILAKTCTCADYKFRQIRCKHIRAVELYQLQLRRIELAKTICDEIYNLEGEN